MRSRSTLDDVPDTLSLDEFDVVKSVNSVVFKGSVALLLATVGIELVWNVLVGRAVVGCTIELVTLGGVHLQVTTSVVDDSDADGIEGFSTPSCSDIFRRKNHNGITSDKHCTIIGVKAVCTPAFA